MRTLLIALLIPFFSLHAMNSIDTIDSNSELEITEEYFSSSSSSSSHESIQEHSTQEAPPEYPAIENEVAVNVFSTSESPSTLSRSSSFSALPPQRHISRNHRKKYHTKKIGAAIAISALALAGGTTPLWTQLAFNTMNEIGSPITAYPGTFNCDNQKNCIPQFPLIARKPNCTYTELYGTRRIDCPEGHFKGNCPLHDDAGCACLIEECEGAEEYKKAYKTACAGKWIVAIQLTITTVTSLVTLCYALAPFEEYTAE